MDNNISNPTSELDGKQDEQRNPDGTFKEGNKVNANGKGGFGDRPETINKEGRPKNEVSIMYWVKKFLEEKEEGHDTARVQELAEQIVKMAYIDKNVILIRELLERIEGKTPLKIEGNIGEGLLAVADKLDDILNDREAKDDGTNTNTNGEANQGDTDFS